MQLLNRCLLAACLLFVVACGTEEVSLDPGGLTIVKSEQANFEARYSTEKIQLVLSSRMSQGKLVSIIEDGRGVTLTRFESTVVDGKPAGSSRANVEASASASLDGLQALSRDPGRVAELMGAYRDVAEALSQQMPSDSPRALRDSLLVHPTVLATAMLHLEPETLHQAFPPRRLPAQALQEDEEPECTGCAPNDDSEDYFAEPVYETVYYESEPTPVSGEVDAERLQIYGRGCHGACGPGCDWCVGGMGAYVCYTNAFCQWHDAHCGAWEHFFDCRWTGSIKY